MEKKSTLHEKREINKYLKKILTIDKQVTYNFVKWANNFLPFRSLKIHYKLLEISCHGIPWLTTWLAFIWMFDNPSMLQMQVNMLIGLILDIVFLALIKAATRRRRPRENIDDDILGQYGPDKFSFPSGHASRSVFVTYFFFNLCPVHFVFKLPLITWVITVCLSRILLNRHHILDIIGGVILGIFEGILIGWVWLNQNTCNMLLSWITDERTEGGEYHV